MIIKSVSKLAKKLGFAVGDDVISLGGFPFVDELDYLFYDNKSKFDAVVLRDGKKIAVKVKKDEFEPMGLVLDYPEMKPVRCRNKCVFCFVDQLPKGLRETLYVKDDDYRFSFISGSYVTMTNVSEEEIERIIRLKLSPLYVSVHALDDKVRLDLVKNPSTSKLRNYMQRLGAAGIKMHTQIVAVPGINDGVILEESIRGLKEIKGVESVAVVPVGLTSHRSGLANLPAVDAENARATVRLVEKLYDEYSGFCWCSDEYYLKAGLPVREFGYYGAFEQIENGVGLVADFADNIGFTLDETNGKKYKGTFALVTGVSFAPLLAETAKNITEKTGMRFEVFGIENNFFGRSVTVAGLVTAVDIKAQAGGAAVDAYVIPDNMLREFEDTFLDGVTLAELEISLKKPIITVRHNGSDFISQLTGFCLTNGLS